MEQNTAKQRVCAYCRVSTKAEKQEQSLISQIEYFNNLINENPNYINMGIYAEKKSGANQVKRSQFLEMIKQCRNRNIDIIYTKTVSRFGRNMAQCLKTLEELTRIGVRVIFEIENIDSIRDKQNIKIAIKSYFAEEELVKDSQAVKFGVQRRNEAGKVVIPNPNPPLGYRYGANRKLILVPKDAKIVKEIFDRYCSGEKVKDIIDSLNERGIKTAGGCKWNYCNLGYLLKQEKYTGDAYLQKYYSDNGHSRANRGEKAMYVVERWCEPIISHEQFQQVQEIRKQRELYDRPVGYVPEYDIFRGIIRCGQCGANFNKQSNGHKTLKHGGKEKQTYRCQNNRMHGNEVCRNKIQDKLTLQDAFIKAFNTMKVVLGNQAKLPTKNEEIIEIDRKIEEFLAKEKIFMQMQVKNLMTEEMQNEYEKLITKVLKLQDRKKEILKHNAEMVEQNTTMNQFKQYFQEIGEMKEFDENICKIMLKEIIVMNRNKLIYKFRNGYTADIEVFDNYLVKDDIGEVKIYASTEC